MHASSSFYTALLLILFRLECGIAQCQRIISGVFYYAPEGSERFFFFSLDGNTQHMPVKTVLNLVIITYFDLLLWV